jgi:hypothetical protein
MSSASTSYAESVLSHLEKVQQLPAEVQTDIARRVDSYIKMAEAAKEEGVVAMLASNAVEEQAKAIGRGAIRWIRAGPRRQLPRHGAMPRLACRRAT